MPRTPTFILRNSKIVTTRPFSSSQKFRKIIPEATQTTPGKRPAEMDGDQTAKEFDNGANSGLGSAELSSGIHEAAHQRDPAGEKTQGGGTPAFSKDGSIGSMFKADGTIGGTADKVGGPFSKDGAIGKNFNPDGAVGGTIDKNLGKGE